MSDGVIFLLGGFKTKILSEGCIGAYNDCSNCLTNIVCVPGFIVLMYLGILDLMEAEKLLVVHVSSKDELSGAFYVE